METTTKQRRPNAGQFRTGHNPRRHRFTRNERVAGFWAAITSMPGFFVVAFRGAPMGSFGTLAAYIQQHSSGAVIAILA
jgi:hypothetical protein